MYYIIVLLSVATALAVASIFALRFYRKWKMQRTIEQLCKVLFPMGNDQRKQIIDRIADMTKNRFSRNDLLDYYLKIKGLQVIDLHTGGGQGIREYLLSPTRIRLNYMEIVTFYDEFLSFPEAVGHSAKGEKYGTENTAESKVQNT